MKYLTVFTNGFRPLKDHLLGLLISIKNESNYKMILFSNTNDTEIIKAIKKINKDKIILLTSRNPFLVFKYCLKSDLIFGSPNGLNKYILILSQLLNRKSFRIILTAGIIFKAIGYFKKERDIIYFLRLYIRNWFFNYFFKYIVLTPTNEYMVYMSAAFSYPPNVLLNYPLPKNIYLSTKINKKCKKKIILFSPTHRWDDTLSPIELLLCNSKFILSLKEKNFDVRYTLHPSVKQKIKFCKDVKLFDSKWEEVLSLITDYSSIGHDYLSSGGKNLIFYIPDINIFEANQGIGPLYKSLIDKNYKASSLKQLKKILFSFEKNLISKKSSNLLNLKLAKKNYFYNLYKIIK